MSDPLIFTKEKYVEGEQAFARGISVAQLINQINVETEDPGVDADASDEVLQAAVAAQKAREECVIGLMLGYLNGVFQAIRRIDQQLMITPQQ